ncbi:MAG TPA: M56 family metallopeptidase [Thermoanaerobaculia bacterium]|jgi:beta-lactamase regulating signal transducer with metallopeptidase domain|nr:M56 family metallopeptidase [Thermoanaerobaculia bacterium]
MIGDLVTHVIVSSAILAAAIAAAAWIRPLTARTRHAILVAGMAALALPSFLVTNLVERNAKTLEPILLDHAAIFNPPAVAGVLKSAAPPVEIFFIVWASVAALLLIRWWIVTRRLVATALSAATPPPQRTKDALDAARRRLGVSHSIDLIASSTCEAPAVVRVLRPMIILPADGCSTLDDEELESLLCHECAHVARRDNLLGVAEAVACSLFWFNPLVWLAHRRIAAAREAACDERVADAALPAETYVGALAKVCRSLLAPRVPAVSCMANAHLKERIQHLMGYDTLRKSALSHRTIVASAMLTVLLTVAAVGVVTADPVTVNAGRYQLNYSMNKTPDGNLSIRMRVIDTETREVMGEPSVITKPGERATTRFGNDQREWQIIVMANPDGSGSLTLVATHDSREVQNTVMYFPAPGVQQAPGFSGAPLSLNLVKADIQDVLRTFGKLSGMEMDIAAEVQGSVTVNVVDTPWDQALDEIIRENGYAYRVEGKTIHVFKP